MDNNALQLQAKVKHNFNAYLITLQKKSFLSFARYAILDINSQIVNAWNDLAPILSHCLMEKNVSNNGIHVNKAILQVYRLLFCVISVIWDMWNHLDNAF